MPSELSTPFFPSMRAPKEVSTDFYENFASSCLSVMNEKSVDIEKNRWEALSDAEKNTNLETIHRVTGQLRRQILAKRFLKNGQCLLLLASK